MRKSNRAALARLMATTSLIALSLTVAPVALSPDIGGAGLSFAESGSSCFVAGTQVLMADGSEKAIELVKTGDAVRNGSGGISLVCAVEAPLLGPRLLYAFNGSKPFVTAEHPFLTMAGWRAVDPAATRRENPSLKVQALRQGDLLTCAHPARLAVSSGNLAQDIDIEYALEALQRLTAQEAAPETVVYNLLLDGEHSFIANGYVVHNKGGEGGESGDDDDGGESGGDDDGGESGGDDDGGESGGDDNGGESGSGGEGGESGENGESEESGEGGESGEAGEFSGDPGEAGEDLNDAEESDLIRRGWQ